MKIDPAAHIATGKVDLAKIRQRMADQAPNPLDARPGKSGMAVGHQAKRAVLDAIEAGVVLPKNAQGLAAARIAGGADPTSVFAALVVPDVPAAEEGTGGPQQGTAPETEVVNEEQTPPLLTGGPMPGTAPDPDLVEEEFGPAEVVVNETQTPPDFGTTSAEAALAMLRAAEE